MRRTGFVLVMFHVLARPAAALDLLQAYELGLRNDPRVLQVEAKRNSALKTKPIGAARLLPSITLQGDFREFHTITGKSPITGQADTNNVYWYGFFNLRLTQPLFHYESWVQFWQADHQIAQAQALLDAEYQSLAVRVARAYFDVLESEERVEVTEVELKNLETQLMQVKERLALGFATVQDLAEVQAQLDRVVADQILFQLQLNDAQQELREIIGNVDFRLSKVPDDVPLARPDPDKLDDWREVAQRSNLNILAAASAAAVAKENIDYHFAGHLPSLDLVGQKAMADNNRPTGINFSESSIGLEVTVPILAGGGVNARVEQARDDLESAQQELDRQRRATERQVVNAFNGVNAAVARVSALRTALRSSQTAVDAAQVGYQVGTRTVVEVLLEQNRFYGIRRDYAIARCEYLYVGLQLKQAAGTLTRSDVAAVNSLLSHDRRAGRGDAERLGDASAARGGEAPKRPEMAAP